MDRASYECGKFVQKAESTKNYLKVSVKKLDFEIKKDTNGEGEPETEEKENAATGGTKLSNLIQRSWSATGFGSALPESKLETRSKSAQKLHQYDYSAIYKRKREEKAKKMEEEIKAQANSFKSRPMPNFLKHKRQGNFPLKITVPITPEVLKRSNESSARKLNKQKVCLHSIFGDFLIFS